MARKTKATATPTLDDEGFLCLQGELLWKWRALDAELRTANLEIETTQARINAEIEKNPALKELLSQKAALAGQLSSAKTELNTVLMQVETVMGVSLKDCAFDDKSGRLYNLGEDGSRGAPMKPNKKKR